MKGFLCTALAAIALAVSPAQAKVASQGATGFSLSYEAEIAGEAKAAFDAFVRVGEWWDGEHSYSGDAKNLTIDLKPGGCWCETLPDGGFVAHMAVVQALPGKTMIFKGGLGPLAFMGVDGAMVLSFRTKDKATLVTMTYAVGGHDPKKFKELPKLVDGVLGAAFKRYTNYVSTGKP
jgi:hypothetical protein